VTTAVTPSSKDGSSNDLAKDVEQKQFVTERRGYDRREVRAFLRTIATHIDLLRGQLELTVSTNAELKERLARAELEVEALRADVAEQRLRHREASSRLELCDVLREDALARAKSAEAGRKHAEDLLVQVVESYRPREPTQAERSTVASGAVGHWTETGPMPEEPKGRATELTMAGRTYLLTADQIRAIEEAAGTPGEMTGGQAARILEAARRNADRVNRAAHELAQL
jgi:DivIVA domain-containing protein